MLQNRFETAASAEDLTRKARRLRIQANRASSTLAAQLVALAAQYEAEARRIPRVRRSRSEAGGATIEYALVLALIATAIISALETLI